MRDTKIIDPRTVLTDVTALSHKYCQYPIQAELVYATRENFLGRIVDGYHADAKDFCLLAKTAATSLLKVQNTLNARGLGLYVFDGYRPHRAVRDFAQWFNAPVTDEYESKRKKIHYPHIEKTDLDRLGYAAGTVSVHNFGQAIDLTLIDLNTQQLLEMGACFDYFDEISHTNVMADQIGQEAFQNRLLLQKTMQAYGFNVIQNEFWHFNYCIKEVAEPMDIPITKALKMLNIATATAIPA